MLYKQFLSKINRANKLSVPFPPATFIPYKFYISRGNNSIIIKQALSSRWWWKYAPTAEWQEYSLMWTPWKSMKMLNMVPFTLSEPLHNNRSTAKMHNHLESNYHLHNKKALFYNLKKYYESEGLDPFTAIPVTFHVQGVRDKEFLRFKEYYFQQERSFENETENTDNTTESEIHANYWIVKPG